MMRSVSVACSLVWYFNELTTMIENIIVHIIVLLELCHAVSDFLFNCFSFVAIFFYVQSYQYRFVQVWFLSVCRATETLYELL